MMIEQPNSFVDIFANDVNTEFLDGAVSNGTRRLAQQDLLRALVQSNRSLKEYFDFEKGVLKTPSQLQILAQNTEQSIYTYNGDNTRKYIETIFTYIVFLVDEHLSHDALLFRLLINLHINDLYLEPSSAEYLFTELIYSTCTTKDKYECLDILIRSIMKEMNSIFNKYKSGEHYNINNVQIDYMFPGHVNRVMEKYQDEQVDLIVDRLLFNKSETPEDFLQESVASSMSGSSSSEKSFINLFSSSENEDEQSLSSRGKSSSSSYFGNLYQEEEYVSDASTISYIPSSDEDIEDDVSINVEDVEDDVSINVEDDDASSVKSTPSIASSVKSTPSIASSVKSTPSIASSAKSTPSIASSVKSTPSIASSVKSFPNSNTSSIKSNYELNTSELINQIKNIEKTQKTLDEKNCFKCNGALPNNNSYKTPIPSSNGYSMKEFCGRECMEDWSP
jgi:hypothetical protein